MLVFGSYLSQSGSQELIKSKRILVLFWAKPRSFFKKLGEEELVTEMQVIGNLSNGIREIT